VVGFDGTGGVADCSAAVLTFLGRPLDRTGLTASVDAEDGWGVACRALPVDVIALAGPGRAAPQFHNCPFLWTLPQNKSGMVLWASSVAR
jgi:hypothetical protein